MCFAWLCGRAVVWLCGCVVVWLCGCVVVWLCGRVVVWWYGCVVVCGCVVVGGVVWCYIRWCGIVGGSVVLLVGWCCWCVGVLLCRCTVVLLCCRGVVLLCCGVGGVVIFMMAWCRCWWRGVVVGGVVLLVVWCCWWWGGVVGGSVVFLLDTLHWAQAGVDMEWEENAGVALEEADELSVVGGVGASVPKPELLSRAERGDAHLCERACDAFHGEDVERRCNVRRAASSVWKATRSSTSRSRSGQESRTGASSGAQVVLTSHRTT